MNTKTEKRVIRNEDKLTRKVSNYISKNWFTILSVAVLVVVLCAGTVFADGGADAMWLKIKEIIGKWGKRLGGVIIFVGGIMFGLGWKREDADGKSQGVSTMIAGAIVLGVCASIDTFF